jgi:hypothetical protein
MAEEQGKHRRELEKDLAQAGIEEMRAKFSEARWGQGCALGLAISFVVGGVYLIVQGHPIPGTIIALTGGGVGLPQIITAFMRGNANGAQPQKPEKQGPATKRKRRN